MGRWHAHDDLAYLGGVRHCRRWADVGGPWLQGVFKQRNGRVVVRNA